MMESHDISALSPIRRQFFALRNGLVADTLRKGGLPQKYIFGLLLPQIKEIAAGCRPADDRQAAEAARELWADRECREARLLACHLMPATEMSREEAMLWASGTVSREEADILAFRLLRYHSDAADIAAALDSSESDADRYAAEALRRFL